MTIQEIEDEKAALQAENAAMLVKSTAVGAVGSIVGFYIGNKQKASFWNKLGYVLAGGYIARLPMALYYTDKLAKNITRIDQLQRMLDAQ